MAAIRARADELAQARELEGARRRKLEDALEKATVKLEETLRVLEGLPVRNAEIAALDRAPHTPGRLSVRVLEKAPGATPLDPGSMVEAFLVTVDPQTLKAWYSWGSQTVTAEEALDIALTAVERKLA